MNTIANHQHPPEAPLWPGPYCSDCIDGSCDRAEHLGLTDADLARGEA